MKRLFVLAIALLVISASAFAQANLVVNGDFSDGEAGWTQWQSPWGGGFVWDTSEGCGALSNSGGSFGWYQAITVTPGVEYTVNANWAGNGSANWTEFLFFNDDGREIYKQCDDPLASSVISKVSPNMAGGMPFGSSGLVPITGFYYASGPGTNKVVATGTTMYVVLKTGASGGSTLAYFDDITVTGVPEPASILALVTGLGGLIIRRKR